MHVLHILEAFNGGTRRHVLDLLPALVRRGVSCTLVASAQRSATFAPDAARLREQGVTVIELPMSRGLDMEGDIRAVRQLLAIARAQRPDIVHCHSSKAGLLGRIARLAFAQIPLVYTPHCLAFDTGLPRLHRRAARWIERLLAPLTSHYIAVSRHEAHIIRACLTQKSAVSVIHNGVDIPDFDTLPATTRATFGLHDDDFVIGCFGRLTAQKNQAALIRALPKIARMVPRAVLFFVGAGEDRAILEKMADDLKISRPKSGSSDSGPRIVWAGERDEARPLYALCDVVAQPSRWEGCPYSVLEAMTAQRPVVVRDVGGVEEIVDGRYGVAYRSADVPALIELIGTLERDAQWRARVGTDARSRIEELFTLDQMVEQTFQVYERVVDKSRM